MRLHQSMVVLSIAVVAACGAAESSEPHQVQPAATDPNFVLYVSNRAADTVDISVYVDDQLAVEGDFPPGQEYSFDLELTTGGHSVNSVSDAGNAQRLDLIDIRGGVIYGVVEYRDRVPDSGQAGSLFTFELLDEPPTFEGSAEGAKH
jgi:hypothetical protein